MSHTKEPWIVIPGGRHDPEAIITTQRRLDGSKGEICGMDVEFTGLHGDEQKANARRIVACVNACAGISNEVLEKFEQLKPAIEHCKLIEQQRDELLAELKKAAAYHRSHECYSEASRLDEYIARAKGSTA